MMNADEMVKYLQREYEDAKEEVRTFSGFGGHKVLMQLQEREDYLHMILNDLGILPQG